MESTQNKILLVEINEKYVSFKLKSTLKGLIQRHKISVMRKEPRNESQQGDKASNEKARVNESLLAEAGICWSAITSLRAVHAISKSRL